MIRNLHFIRLLKIIAICSLWAAAWMPARSNATSPCASNGGQYQCTSVIPRTPWQYSVCDDTGNYINRLYVWCSVLGGTWDPSVPTCLNAAPITEGNAYSVGGQFETRYHSPCPAGGGAANTCSNYHCSCSNSSFGGVSTLESTLQGFSGPSYNSITKTCTDPPWAETIVVQRQRQVTCPAGYIMLGQECYKAPPCNECAGNPVDVGNGDKLQRETDYVSPAPGALRFTRHYNSGGYFSPTLRDPVNSDFWRHSYSSHVIPFPGNAYILAAIVRPEGNVMHFNLSGVEMQNNGGGAANRLQKLLDSGGATIGWRLTTPASDVEVYDAEGRLTSVTTRAGFATTLTYNAQGQLQRLRTPSAAV